MKNREVLFKGKRVDNGVWVEGFYAYDAYNFQHTIFATGKDNLWMKIEVHPDTVCQFTGLLDKNGNKIFEGDVIERPENHKCTGEDLSIGKYQVVYDSYNLRYALKTIKSEIFKEGSIVNFHGILTKTGNIHD